MKTKTVKEQPEALTCIYEARTPQRVLRDDFCKTLRIDQDAMTNLDIFMAVMEGDIMRRHSFSYVDVIKACVPYDIPRREVENYWNDWKDFLLKKGKLEIVMGVEEVFLNL